VDLGRANVDQFDEVAADAEFLGLLPDRLGLGGLRLPGLLENVAEGESVHGVVAHRGSFRGGAGVFRVGISVACRSRLSLVAGAIICLNHTPGGIIPEGFRISPRVPPSRKRENPPHARGMRRVVEKQWEAGSRFRAAATASA